MKADKVTGSSHDWCVCLMMHWVYTPWHQFRIPPLCIAIEIVYSGIVESGTAISVHSTESKEGSLLASS